MKKYDTKKLTVTALLTAAAMILSYVESMIPSFAVPGVKIGLANIASVFALFSLGEREAWGISTVRVLLSGILFGNITSIIYSLTGAVFSLVSMTLLKKTGSSILRSLSKIRILSLNILADIPTESLSVTRVSFPTKTVKYHSNTRIIKIITKSRPWHLMNLNSSDVL